METESKEVIILHQDRKDLTNSPERLMIELPKYWEKDYINGRISNISNISHKMLIKFLWMSGVRITEGINIRKCDIDFRNYMMRVRWLKSRKYKERILPIHPTLKQILEVYTAALKTEEKVFPITRQRAWQLTMKYLGGHPHQLRHSFAVNWIRNGGDMIILHKILGHSKIQTTMEYLKIVPIDQGKELLKISFD